MKENFRSLLTIKRIGINGEGIGYYKKKAVFVPYVLPDEQVITEHITEEKKYINGRAVEIKVKSPHRVKAPCPYFEQCGGCQLQHLEYQQQLEAKKDGVIQALTRYVSDYEKIGIKIFDTIGMDEPYYYRNKAQMPVSFDGKELVTGLYATGSNHLVHISTCMIQDKIIDNIIDELKRLFMQFDMQAHNRKSKKGTLRTIAVRHMQHTKETQVVIVLTRKDIKHMKNISETVMEKFPEVKSFYVNINPDIRSHQIYGDQFIHINGEETIQAQIGEIRYMLSPNSFFQLNTDQTKVLYDVIKHTAQFKKTDKIIDAYCGAGAIGLYLASSVGEVRGVDATVEAIEDAKRNAELNNIDNAYFEAGDSEVVIPNWIQEGFKPDVLIMDPPRTGIDYKLLEVLRKVKIKKLIYVSCNPSTLAKDLNELRRKYDIVSIQPVDMFPQTAHIESVVLLTRK